MEREWHYLENTFSNVTERNYKKALIISNYHDAAIKAAMDAEPDPDFATLYNRYHPLHVALVEEYTRWKNAGGIQEGNTLNLEQLLGLMVTKLDNWDPRIQIVHAKTTPRYKQIFPDGKKPFYQGSKDTRVEAVNTLSQNIGAEAPLATIKAEVDTYYTDLSTARDTQAGSKAGSKISATVLVAVIEAAMKMQYGNLGFLINKFMDTPQVIAPFFDVPTIRERDQRIFTGTLDPLENEAVLTHTFLADDELRLKIEGTAPAKFYLGSEPNGIDSTPIEVAGNHEVKITASQFGITNYHEHRHLTVVNTSNTIILKYLVELY